MASMLRRSGVMVGMVANALQWKADYVIQVGVGQKHQEVDVLGEEWEGVKFIGFEACPTIYSEIKDEYSGELYNLAITDFEGMISFYQKKHHADGSSLFKLIDEGLHKVTVKASSLDIQFPPNHFVVQGKKKILLWLDCEGSEFAALRGAEKRFLSKVDMVLVEMTANPPSPYWGSPDKIHRCLLKNGFVRQWIFASSAWAGQYDAVYVRKEMFNPLHCCDPINCRDRL